MECRAHGVNQVTCTVCHGNVTESFTAKPRVSVCEGCHAELVAQLTGAKEKRPELDRLMADAHRRRFDAVVVWKFDRFARSVSHLLRALETFNSLGIAFVSLSEQIDTTTPTGRMVFTVLGAVAELERSLIAERVRAGLRNARAKGKQLGRPRAVVEVARITALRAQARSRRAIARELGVGEGTVRRACAKNLPAASPVSACDRVSAVASL